MVLHFHPNSDYLIWTGNKDCGGTGEHCWAEAQFSRDNGRTWSFVEDYVKNCAFAKDEKLDADPTEIICEIASHTRLSKDHRDYLALIILWSWWLDGTILRRERGGCFLRMWLDLPNFQSFWLLLRYTFFYFLFFLDWSLWISFQALPSRDMLELQVSLDGSSSGSSSYYCRLDSRGW